MQEETAADVLRLYHPDADARLQSLHVQPGTRSTARSIPECLFRNLVGRLYPANRRIRGHLSCNHSRENVWHLYYISGCGHWSLSLPVLYPPDSSTSIPGSSVSANTARKAIYISSVFRSPSRTNGQTTPSTSSISGPGSLSPPSSGSIRSWSRGEI